MLIETRVRRRNSGRIQNRRDEDRKSRRHDDPRLRRSTRLQPAGGRASGLIFLERALNLHKQPRAPATRPAGPAHGQVVRKQLGS